LNLLKLRQDRQRVISDRDESEIVMKVRSFGF
jgi:hypothetical protein